MLLKLIWNLHIRLYLDTNMSKKNKKQNLTFGNLFLLFHDVSIWKTPSRNLFDRESALLKTHLVPHIWMLRSHDTLVDNYWFKRTYYWQYVSPAVIKGLNNYWFKRTYYWQYVSPAVIKGLNNYWFKRTYYWQYVSPAVIKGLNNYWFKRTYYWQYVSPAVITGLNNYWFKRTLLTICLACSNQGVK